MSQMVQSPIDATKPTAQRIANIDSGVIEGVALRSTPGDSDTPCSRMAFSEGVSSPELRGDAMAEEFEGRDLSEAVF